MFKPTLRSVIKDVTRKDTGRPFLNPETITKVNALLHVIKGLEIESIISLIDGAFPAIGKTFDTLCVVLDTLTGVTKKEGKKKAAAAAAATAGAAGGKKKGKGKEGESTEVTEDLVVNVKSETKRALKKETYPGTIVREAVLLQYVVDARLDRAVEETLEHFMENPQPRRNPVSTIALKFRDYEVRHLLWNETDGELLKEVAKAQSFVAGSTGKDKVYGRSFSGAKVFPKGSDPPDGVFGTESALQFVNAKKLQPLAELIAEVTTARKGKVSCVEFPGWGWTRSGRKAATHLTPQLTHRCSPSMTSGSAPR